MSGAVTVKDVMARDFLGVSEGDLVGETVELLLAEGVECAVVLRGHEPVGLLTERDALATLAGGDPSSAVADAMTDPAVTVPAGERLPAVAGRMAREGVRWVLAVTDDEPVGLVTAHDVVTASTLVPEADRTFDADARFGADEPVGLAGEPAVTGDGYSTQGVCEACGTLARGLADANGRLVCPNCREA
jgi:CBS domain-containing protein